MPSVILCVDDDHIALSVRRLLLSTKGYSVLTANSVETALGLLNLNHVDLLITDHLLPDGTGAELIAVTKCFKSEVPTVLLTGWPEVPPGYAFADLVLTKGIVPQDFLAKIGSLVSPHRNIA